MPLCKWDLITSAEAESYYNAYFDFHTISGIICAFYGNAKVVYATRMW
jgi:hypothetical protein